MNICSDVKPCLTQNFIYYIKKRYFIPPPVRKPEAIDNTHPRQDILLLGDIIFKNSLKKPENKAFSGFFISTGDERIELPPKVLESCTNILVNVDN